MVYSERFAREKPDLARRFMRAYVKALRMFNDSIDNGKWRATPLAEDVIGLMAKRLEIPPASIRNAFPHAVHPDGLVNLDAMRLELAFFREKGLVQSPAIKAENLVDMRFVEAAVKGLGPYKRAQ